jgi:hypothetical protein
MTTWSLTQRADYIHSLNQRAAYEAGYNKQSSFTIIELTQEEEAARTKSAFELLTDEQFAEIEAF